MHQMSFEDFLSFSTESQTAPAPAKPIKIIEVIVDNDGARLVADGELELFLDRDPQLEDYYRCSEIENCFIDSLVAAGTVDDRLTDDTEWCRKVKEVD